MQGNNEQLILLGKRIKQLRLSKKQSLENLCFKNGLEPSTVSRIEQGIVDTKYLTLLKLAKALNLSISEMLDLDKLK